ETTTGAVVFPNTVIHHRAHARPVAPHATNTHRQFPCVMIAAIAGGATTAPIAVPALTMPIAVDRSPTGNHSAMTLVAAGKPPPSPAPSRNRLPASIHTLVARLCEAHASDQNSMIIRKPRRVP